MTLRELFGVLLIVCGLFVFNWIMAGAIVSAFDSSMDNKDIMLCNSAKESGNEIYLEKCICFYGGENIRCIYKEE